MKEIKKLVSHSFIDCLDKDSIIVDLGANIGGFIGTITDILPYKKALLFEADPNLIKRLKKVFSKKRGVEIINAVVGPENKEKTDFFISRASSASSTFENFSEMGTDKEQGIKEKVEIEMINIENIFKRFGLDKIDLLKIDVEGAEWEIIEKFPEKFFKKIKQLTIEFHDFNDPSLRKKTEKCINKLKENGYIAVLQGSEVRFGTPYIDCLFYKENLVLKKRNLIEKFIIWIKLLKVLTRRFTYQKYKKYLRKYLKKS